MVTKHEFEVLKEQKQSKLRDLDLDIMDNQISAKEFDVLSSKEWINQSRFKLGEEQVKTEIAESKITLQEAKLGQSYAQIGIENQKLIQLKDGLEFETKMTEINREGLMVNAGRAALQLHQAKIELAQERELFQLSFSSDLEMLNDI